MTPERFISILLPHASLCANATLMPTPGLIAVPALETGWGRSLLQQGCNTYNLFNIKGQGPVGSVRMDSYEWLTRGEWNRLRKRGVSFTLTGRSAGDRLEGLLVQNYRAYNNYDEAYADFVGLLRSKPRYSPVLHARDPYWFCTALELSGYATDPQYAEKLHNILRKRVIPALEVG